jgi:DNA-binding NtrC family response regulator
MMSSMDAPRTILVVDDEPPVCHALQRTLTDSGYEVLTAADGEEAIKVLESNPVQLLICDHNMPGMSGIDLLKIVGVRYPRIMRVMLTGDTDPDLAMRSINEGEVYRFLRKPWNKSDLRTIVHFAFRVVKLEEEKRRLVAMVRRQQAGAQADPAEVEAELLMLAEEEAKEG